MVASYRRNFIIVDSESDICPLNIELLKDLISSQEVRTDIYTIGTTRICPSKMIMYVYVTKEMSSYGITIKPNSSTIIIDFDQEYADDSLYFDEVPHFYFLI